jgi:hypothetical protein
VPNAGAMGSGGDPIALAGTRERMAAARRDGDIGVTATPLCSLDPVPDSGHVRLLPPRTEIARGMPGYR